MLNQYKTYRQFHESGFSLIEVAMVLLIMGLVLGGLLISLGTTQEINNRNDAESQLNEVVEALYGFAQATGRLPCPATAASSGLEAPVGGGACTQQHGFVPAVTLGISGAVNNDNLLMDGWQSPLRYSVTTSNGNAFTTANGMRNTTMGALTPDLRVCADAGCATIIVSAVPVVLLSLGADWASFDAADVEETENSGEATINGYRHGNDNNFVQTGYIEDNFDDLLVWVSPSILFTRMIAAGQLP